VKLSKRCKGDRFVKRSSELFIQGEEKGRIIWRGGEKKKAWKIRRIGERGENYLIG